MIHQRLREFACVSLPKILGGIGLLGMNILLLRYMDATAFGALSLCLAAILIVDAVAGAAIDMGVLRLASARGIQPAAGVLPFEQVAIDIKLLLSLLGLLILWPLLDPIRLHIFDNKAAASLPLLTWITACSMLLLRSTLVHKQLQQRFESYGILDLAQILIKFGAVGLVIWLLVPTPEAILISLISGPLLVFLYSLLRSPFLLLHHRLHLISTMGELFGYVKWYLLTFALGALISRMDIFLISFISDLKDVGLFSGALVYATIPELLGSYLAVVFGPRIMPALRDGTFARLYNKVQLALFTFAFCAYALFLIGSNVLGSVLFPPGYADSAKLVAILLPGMLAGMASFPLTVSYLLFTRPRFLLYLDLFSLPLVLPLYIISIQDAGIIGAAWVTMGTRLFTTLIAQATAWVLVNDS